MTVLPLDSKYIPLGRKVARKAYPTQAVHMIQGRDYQRMFAYDAWANQAVYEALVGSATPPEDAVRYLAHILATEWLWMMRMKQEPQRYLVWPDWTLAACEQQSTQLKEAWTTYLSSLGEAELEEGVAYVNTKGQRWTNTRGDMLMHVIMHSKYHRGQIARVMRLAGHEPAYTDFIHAIRQGFVD